MRTNVDYTLYTMHNTVYTTQHTTTNVAANDPGGRCLLQFFGESIFINWPPANDRLTSYYQTTRGWDSHNKATSTCLLSNFEKLGLFTRDIIKPSCLILGAIACNNVYEWIIYSLYMLSKLNRYERIQ